MKNLLILALSAASAVAIAGPNLVQNGNFNMGTPAFPNAYYVQIDSTNEATALPDWTVVGNNVAGIGPNYLGGSDDEIDLSGVVDNSHSAGGDPGIYQNLATKVGQRYRLTFEIYTGQPDHDGSVDVFAGSDQLGSLLQGGSGPNETKDHIFDTISFTATSTLTKLEFLDGSKPPPNGGLVAQIGQVQVVSTPAPPAYFAMGLPFLLIFRRRAKK